MEQCNAFVDASFVVGLSLGFFGSMVFVAFIMWAAIALPKKTEVRPVDPPPWAKLPKQRHD